MEKENQKNQSNQLNKNKKLVILLGVSVVCLIGIFFYALHWEEIESIDWKGKFEAKKEYVSSWIETHKPEKKTKEDIEVTEKMYECGICYMSHKVPVLMKVATENENLLDVNLISQKDVGYLTGCELVSAAMVLQYYGIEAEPKDVYEVIQKSENSEVDWGRNPNMCFVGDPVTVHGFGCYVTPLVEAMNQLAGDEWRAVNVSDSELSYLEEMYLSKDNPIIIWATINMTEPIPGDSWKLPNGKEFQWLAGEHCLVIVGADEQYYYFNDPNHEGEVIGYEKEIVELRYEQLGKQAIIMSR